MKALILAILAAGIACWCLLATAGTPGGALTAATGLSAAIAMPALIAAWLIIRTDATTGRRTT